MSTARSILIALLAAFAVEPSASASRHLKPELLLTGGCSHLDGWVGRGPHMQKNAVGFEYYRTFSDEYGDVLTADLQVRLPYDPSHRLEDAWGVEIHNAWLQWKMGIGQWLRVGHFDPAFGLEPVLDTHGTLLQTLALDSIGYKKDWGLEYRTLLGDYDIRLAAQAGSGMGLRRNDEPYLLTSRLGRTFDNDWQLGLSFLHGETLRGANTWTIPAQPLVSHDAASKTLVGFDAQGSVSVFRLMGETAWGRQDGRTVGGLMLQGQYTLPEHQQIDLKVQARAWSHDTGDSDRYDLTLGFVTQYIVSSALSLRLGYLHDLHSEDGNDDRMILLQLYYLQQ